MSFHSMERFITEPSLIPGDLGDDLMIYDSRTGNVHILNKTARFIWECIKSGACVSTIVAQVEAEYDSGASENVLTDVSKIVDALCRTGLIVPSEVTGSEEK